MLLATKAHAKGKHIIHYFAYVYKSNLFADNAKEIKFSKSFYTNFRLFPELTHS